MKKFADDNLKSYENGRKFSKRVENTVGKREINCSSGAISHISHSVFKRLVLQTLKNEG